MCEESYLFPICIIYFSDYLFPGMIFYYTFNQTVFKLVHYRQSINPRQQLLAVQSAMLAFTEEYQGESHCPANSLPQRLPAVIRVNGGSSQVAEFKSKSLLLLFVFLKQLKTKELFSFFLVFYMKH